MTTGPRFATLLVGPLSRRLNLSAIAPTGYVIAGVGLLAEALLASTLAGTAAGSLVFVTGVSLAVSAMISLFGEAAAPHQAAGMAFNGFVLFLGASIGPLAPGIGLSFAALLHHAGGPARHLGGPAHGVPEAPHDRPLLNTPQPGDGYRATEERARTRHYTHPPAGASAAQAHQGDDRADPQ